MVLKKSFSTQASWEGIYMKIKKSIHLFSMNKGAVSWLFFFNGGKAETKMWQADDF